MLAREVLTPWIKQETENAIRGDKKIFQKKPFRLKK